MGTEFIKLIYDIKTAASTSPHWKIVSLWEDNAAAQFAVMSVIRLANNTRGRNVTEIYLRKSMYMQFLKIAIFS